MQLNVYQMFKWFNKVGMCMSVFSIRNLIDRLRKKFNRRIKEWKAAIEEVRIYMFYV